MSKLATEVARAVSRIFRKQRQLVSAGRSRLHDTDGAFARELETALGRVYAWAMTRYKGKDEDWAREAAAIQARTAAFEVNEATNNYIAADKPSSDIFSPERAALIGLDQFDKAVGLVQTQAAKLRGKRLKWVTDGHACPKVCAKLAGKVRKPGKPFVVLNGVPIYNAPAHVSCRCRTEECD